MFYIKLWMLLCLLTNFAFGGDQKGSGGSSVDCGERSYLLDFYLRPGNYPETSMNEIELVEVVLNKMAKFDAIRAEMYKEQLKNFFAQTAFVDTHLGTISDTGIFTGGKLPNNCRYLQAAIQKLVVFGKEKRFYISLEQWNKFSTTHKAGLILHELLYLELRSKNSLKLGAFNAYLFRNLNAELNEKEFFFYYKDAGFKWIYLWGIPVNAQTLKITDRGLSAMGTAPDMPFDLLGQKVFSELQFLDAHPTGVPKVVNYRGAVNYEHEQMSFKICGTEKTCKIGFHPNGSISWLNQVEVTHRTTGKVESGKTIRFDAKGKVTLDL